jgi:hypothetical protein
MKRNALMPYRIPATSDAGLPPPPPPDDDDDGDDDAYRFWVTVTVQLT